MPTNAVQTPTPTIPTTSCTNGVTLTVDVVTDSYPEESSWTLVNTCTGQIQEMVKLSTLYDTAATSYSNEYCVPIASYNFTMNDSYGDGVCCQNGEGSYTVIYDGVQVASGGVFSSAESTIFGVCATQEPTMSPSSGRTHLLTTSPPSLSLSPSPVTVTSISPTKSLAPSRPYHPSIPPTVSAVPSQAPSQAHVLFDGIDDAGSMYRGVIDISWDFPTYDGEIVDLDTVKYHVLSSVGSYDFESTLANTTAEELIFEFEDNSLNDNAMQYHLVEGEAFEFSLNTTFDGELHTILVIAEVDGMYSRNVEPTEIYSTISSPTIKDDVNIVGVFIPTENLDIFVSKTLSTNNSLLEFIGPVRSEHKNLTLGDFVRGFTSEGDPFFLLVIEVVVSSDQQVILNTDEGRLEDVFDSLDFEASYGVSRPGKVPLNQDSVQTRHRHLVVRRHSRKLFFGSIIGGAKKVGKFIGDRVSDVADSVKGLYDLITKGEGKSSINSVDMNVPINLKLSKTSQDDTDDDRPTKGSQKVVLGQVQGKIQVRSDLYVKLKVSLKSLGAEVGWKADYSTDLEVTLSGELQVGLNKRLWKGEEKHKTFMIGPVPVPVTFYPELNLELSISAKAREGLVTLKVGGKGKGHLSVSATLPQGLSADFKPPGFDPHFDYELADGPADFGVSLSLLPSIHVELYKGILTGDVGFAVGSSLTAGADFFNEDACSTLDKFDIGASISGFVNFGSNLGKGLSLDAEIFNIPIPILSANNEECPDNGSCSESFFDDMAEEFKEVFNSQIFLSQAASPNDPPTPSKVYKFEDFMKALKSLNGKDKFKMWLGDGCGSKSKKQAFVNIAAFLGQARIVVSMLIIYLL